MILTQILDLQTNENPPRKLREQIAAVLNDNYERGYLEDAVQFAFCLFFKCPGHKVTSSTTDLAQCLVIENCQFPPYESEKWGKIKTVNDFMKEILKDGLRRVS